jgi:hypothetical protein
MVRKAIFDLTGQIYRRVIGYIDWFLVPVENCVLNWYARKYPQQFRARLEHSIEKGFKYFEAQSSLILDAILTFNIIVNKTFDPRLALLSQKAHEYCKQWKDPHIRLLYKDYDLERDSASCPNEFNVDELSRPERPILKSLYADRLGLSEDFLAELETIDDKGGYGTTHILLACVILKTFSTIPHEAINPVLESTIAPILRAQRRTRVDDVYVERTAFLQEFGYQHHIQPAWILRIMLAQLEDGGWFEWRSLFRTPSHQHPSSLALAALIQYRELRLKNRADDPELRSSNIGEVLSLSGVKKAVGTK